MSEKDIMKRKADAVIEAYKSKRLRWVTGRSQVKMEIEEERYRKVVDSIMQDEIERHMIIGAIKEKGLLTIEDIAQLTNLQPSKILKHVIALRRNGVLDEAGEKNRQYLYKLL
jgi:Fic family protein